MTDINKCKHFKEWYESRPNGFGGVTIEDYCTLYKDNCEKHPQCLFRNNQTQQLITQLKRKEQENVELKKELSSLLAEKNAMEIGRYEYKQQCEEHKQELAELKEALANFCGCETRDKFNIPICEGAEKYKQALDEIEKLTDIREVHGLTDTEYVDNFRLHQERILDIIDKAKE